LLAPIYIAPGGVAGAANCRSDSTIALFYFKAVAMGICSHIFFA